MRASSFALAIAAVLAADCARANHHHDARVRRRSAHAGASLVARDEPVSVRVAQAAVASNSASAAVKKTAAKASAEEDTSPKPLFEHKYKSIEDVPYQVNPFAVGRGPQTGYNIWYVITGCQTIVTLHEGNPSDQAPLRSNSTTAGPDSECQTMIVNDMSDFCLWGAGGTEKNAHLGDIEGSVVAYCLKSQRGGRPLPPSAIKGLQMTRTDAYIQIVGKVDLTALGFAATDEGGEVRAAMLSPEPSIELTFGCSRWCQLDPFGADGLGNAIGALMFSDQLPSSPGKLVQARRWNQFWDGGLFFCMKVCDPKMGDPNYCLNTYDTIGCRYNMPSTFYDDESVQNTFTECDGEVQDVVGQYEKGGKMLTWELPRPLTTEPPYTPRVPSSSNCKTYQSTILTAARVSASLASILCHSSKTDILRAFSQTTSSATASATPLTTASARASLGRASSAFADLAATRSGASKSTITTTSTARPTASALSGMTTKSSAGARSFGGDVALVAAVTASLSFAFMTL